LNKRYNIEQKGGSVKHIEPIHNNPFEIQERNDPVPDYMNNNSSNYKNSKPNYNQNPKPNYANKYKETNPYIRKQDPSSVINLFPQTPVKPQGLAVNPSPYLAWGIQDHNKAGFPKFYNPYGPKMNEQYYNVGGEHSIPIGFIKNYNIFPNNINDYQTKYLPLIYEDSIPMRGAKHELTTLSERRYLYEYIKNNLVSYEEGEDGCMNHNSGINLLRQLKYLYPHPINYSILYTSPLRGLREGIRIYRSCYPITTNRSNQTMCQKTSNGLHIKFYKKDYFIAEAQNNTKLYNEEGSGYNNMDRELEFYKYIRTNVLQKVYCPNFTWLYTWNDCTSCNEQFNRYDQSRIIRPMAAPFTQNMKVVNKYLKKDNSPNKSCKILITESPDMNILEWMTNSRKIGINKRTQTAYGYHTDDVWKSIYFQIFAGIYTLQKKSIYIPEFDYDNIWIKTIPRIGFWEYIIEGISYYVPNCGFLVLIDCSCQNKITVNDLPAIMSTSLFNDTDDTDFDYKTMWTNIINDNPFGRGKVNIGIRLPSVRILQYLSECNKIINNQFDTDFNDIFPSIATEFLHSRFGHALNSDEMNKCILDGDPMEFTHYNPGDMVAHEDGIQKTYTWGIFVSDKLILIKKNDKIMRKSISESDIHKNTSNNIVQMSSNNIYGSSINLNESPLETYHLY